MKFHGADAGKRRLKSLPIRGAWIEILACLPTLAVLPGRSPSGERGLKYERQVDHVGVGVSLPIRGAWIEISAR